MSAINITVGIVSTAVKSGLNAIRNQFADLRKAANGEFANMLALGGILTGIGAVFRKAFDSAAQMETLETGFKTLLGSAEAARARMQELTKFGAETPFELPEVAKASRVLETLTNGALATGEGLRMVGDVASATNQPFDEIAVHIGRMYAGLKGGRPVGEAMNRLMELGVISTDVRQKIEDLQAEGKKGDEVWNVAAKALGRFSGEMDRQSATWAGKMSNLQDNVGALFRSFGEPIVDSLKPVLDAWIEQAGNGTSAASTLGDAVVWLIHLWQSFALLATVAVIGIGKSIAWLAGSIWDIFGNLGAATARLFAGDFGGARARIRAIGDDLKRTAREFGSDMDAIAAGANSQMEEIWKAREKINATGGATATPQDAAQIEETKKIKDLKEKIAEAERKHQIDILDGERKINAMIQERERLLGLANDTDSKGLDAQKDAMEMGWKIDEEREKFGKNITDALLKEKSAKEDLAVASMDEEEKRAYYAQQRDAQAQAAKNYEDAGLEKEAAEARTKALEYQQKLTTKDRPDVVASSIQKIGGGGGAYMSNAKPTEETARNTAAAADTLKRVDQTLKRIEEFSKHPPTWKP